MTEKIILAFMAINTIFLVGYAVGRRVGRAQGEKVGYQESKSILRLKANTQAHCPICNQPNKLY
ncbi:hypothetical protein HYG86_17945 [Alkalicella caledoniensis]|uniref:Uncharacterized protein n=1 Tax=Alkalicella caledoniensis TaxID=2731377 RepID=A0A7G9WCV8_ALKCA|nr:hypothetical protein [Alkalicella caledoniensis]QNO16520.1 hypothetical protein HYG86_17945 [Alkalicella caledoniensis]